MAVVAQYADGTPTPRPVGTHQVTERTASGKFLRTVWRTHFYAAIFAAPLLALMAITGLVIMYIEPITGLLHPGSTRVAAHAQPTLGLGQQQAQTDAVAAPGATLFRVVTQGARPGHRVLLLLGTGRGAVLQSEGLRCHLRLCQSLRGYGHRDRSSGTPWSEYWGKTWNAVNTTLTPGSEVDAPSTLAKAGDLDRFGKRIS
jgi:uncharacterized iron-regulated membrane protein